MQQAVQNATISAIESLDEQEFRSTIDDILSERCKDTQIFDMLRKAQNGLLTSTI